MEGKPCSVLDITGLAQRNGPVTSHIRFSTGEELAHSTRIPEATADLVLAADLVVAELRPVHCRQRLPPPGRTGRAGQIL